MPRPCRSPAMPCRYGFRMCPSHLLFTVRPCLIHTCHAAPMPCSDHAAHLKATAQHGRRESACGLPARIRLLPATTRSSTKVIRSIPISDAGGQSKQPHHSLITITQSLNHIALVRGCFASVRYPLLTFSHLNLSPYKPPTHPPTHLPPTVPEHKLTDRP
jgi:hypothetical protein